MRCDAGAVRRWPALFLFLCSGILTAQQTSVQHDRAFWRAIAQQHYAVPNGESASVLAHELSWLLASPDSELRDDLAYSILAHWIARPNVLPPENLLLLEDEWRENLKSGIGEAATDSVLKRSFSALCLASIAEREAKQPFLGASRYRQLVADAAAYLQAERDLRGYDAKLGWIHATAHTADLLQALAGSPMLSSDEQATILSAIAARLASAPQVYIQGEQDRIAQAVLAVIRRPDFNAESFTTWLDQMANADQKVWADPLTPESLARYQNHTYMLQALSVHLALEPESTKIAEFKKRVLEVLRTR
jgi:Protein of unknown function (DUF2785)